MENARKENENGCITGLESKVDKRCHFIQALFRFTLFANLPLVGD